MAARVFLYFFLPFLLAALQVYELYIKVRVQGRAVVLCSVHPAVWLGLAAAAPLCCCFLFARP